MILVILTALAAVCGAAKLDRSYLPPISARTAGGAPGDLLAPLDGTNQGLPTGSYTNDVQGVVVDAVNPGTRTSELETTGLGGPRTSYGSINSKVGDAAFIGSRLGSPGPNTRIAPGFGSFVESDGGQAGQTSDNTLKFTSDVGLENYSYGFKTDNGISVGENGVAADGVKAQGAYSYKGDDGKTYSVSYTADEGGYKPQGQHLPTPPPIPNEILISLEKNAKEEAAGHVDDGSYDAQKYNNEGDYSSNGAGNNNGRPTIGGGDATSSGSYVSQSSEVHRPTSGVLVGSYNPGSDAISSQGHSSQGFGQSGNKQSSFHQGSSSQDVPTSFSSQSTENRFGVQTTKSERTGSGSSSAFASNGPLSSGFKNENVPQTNPFGSVGSGGSDSSGSILGSQTQFSGFHEHSQSSNLPSSASASASTFGNQHGLAQVTQQGNGLNTESSSNTFPSRFGGQPVGSSTTNSGYLPPVNTIQSLGKPSSNFIPQGFDSLSLQSQFGSANTQISGSQSPQASFAFESNQGPTKVPDTDLATPFESNAQPASLFNHQSSNQASHSFGSSDIPLTLPTPANPVSSTPSGSIDAAFASSTQKPFITQQQGSDDSYYYKQPSKPFITPPANPNSQFSNNREPIIPISSITQPESPGISSATGQYQGTSSSAYNGITQAAISPFSSDSSSSSTQFASQSSQLGSKPSTQFGQSSQQTSTQFGSTDAHFGNKPIVQSQTQFGHASSNQNSDSSQSPTQQYQGTIYQYNKPATTLPVQGHKDTSSNFEQASLSQTNLQGKPGQIKTETKFGTQQGSSQFGSQSTFQQAQKPIVSSQVSGSNYQQVGNFGSHFGQKPLTTQGSTISSNRNTQTSFGSTTNRFGEKPQSAQGSGLTSPYGQTSFGQKPSVTTQTGFSYQQGQFGTGSQFGTKPQTPQGSSFTYSQSQTSQFGKKPVSTIQTGITSQQSQFGSSGSQFGQNSQTVVGAGSVSTTTKPSYAQKPFGSTTYPQSQFGSVGSQFGSKPQTIQGSSFNYGQSSQFGKKPVSTALSGSQFGQNTQSIQGSGLTSTHTQTSFGVKPVYQQSQFGSQYSQGQTSQFGKKPVSSTQTGVASQQSQFGSSGSQFGQNSQTTLSASTTTKPSYTQKPFGSTTYPQSQFGSVGSQFGSKPQTTQGYSFTYGQSQTSQYGKKPVSAIQTGVTSQQTQFGSSGSQSGQNSQTNVGAGSISTTTKPSYSQKPFGSTAYQQSQFGSVGSQFGPKPQATQGSSFTYGQSQTSQYGKKPVSAIQTGVSSQQTQFGSSGSQFGQNSQTNVGAGSISTTTKPSYSQKPIGSTTYQQSQFGSVGSRFGSKPQTTQGSSFTDGQVSSPTSQIGKKPVITTQTGVTSQQTQFGSSGSHFGQNSHPTQGSAVVLTTSKPVFAIKPVYQQPQFGISGSKFGQNSQSTQVTTTTKPSYGQTSFGASSQQTQFGSQFGQKPQTTQGSGFNSNTYSQSQSQFGKKPSGSGSTFQQTQFGSAGSQSGQKPLTTTVTGVNSTPSQTAFGQKYSTSAQTGSFHQQSQFGSSGPQFDQKPQSATPSSSFTSNTGSKGQAVQTTQFGITGSSQNKDSSAQSTQFGSATQYGQRPQASQGIVDSSTGVSSQFGNKISGSSSTSGSSFQQNLFAGSSGSHVGQTSQTTQGTTTPIHTSQYGIKLFGSSQNKQGSTQFGSTPSRFGETGQRNVPVSTTISQTAQPTQFGQKPSQTQFGFTSGHFGQKPQAHASAFATSSGSNVVPFGSTGQVSKYQQTSQFGVNNQGVTSTQKPLGSSLSQTNYQQYSQNSDKSGSQSQFGQALNSNVGTGQFGSHTTFSAQSPKPFGFQSTYKQTQFTQGQKPFGSSQGSAYQIGQSVIDQPAQGTGQAVSVAGYNYQKPQTVFTTQHGNQRPQDQNVQQTQTNFNSAVSTTQTPIAGPSHKPFEISSTQGSFQQSQLNVGSSHFGTQPHQPTKVTEINGPVIQTSYNQFSGQPFKPASTSSTQGSLGQSQASAISSSQFGLQATKPAEVTHISGHSIQHGSSHGSQTAVGSTPEYSVYPSHGVVLPTPKPSHLSVEPYNPLANSGSNEGLIVSAVQTPIVPVPGYEIITTAQGSSHGLVGLGEQFGGPREPPRFDDKTGYHY